MKRGRLSGREGKDYRDAVGTLPKFRGQLVYILGAGHSGSTLLDLVIGRSAQIISMGEIHRLAWYVVANAEPCTCGRGVGECPFWGGVNETARGVLGWRGEDEPFAVLDPMLWKTDVGNVAGVLQKAGMVIGNRRLHDFIMRRFTKKHKRAVEWSFFWYEMVRRFTGALLLVDSTKDVRRFKALYLERPDAVRCIRLIRDGRAVAASAMRRRGCSMRHAALFWLTVNLKIDAILLSVPNSAVMTVRYEDLCTRTTDVMGDVSEFLGVPLDGGREIRRDDVHIVGGNPMRFRWDEDRIELDERWKKELGKAELRVFGTVAGFYNRRWGYE